MAALDETSVVIVGADHPTGLGIGRALYDKNAFITGICKDETPCCKSKVWNQLIRIDSYENIIEHLLRLGEVRDNTAALFLASDNLVKIVSDNREILKKGYHFLLPEKNVVDCFLDKTKFHRWALENGFRVPQSAVCSTREELEFCLSSIPYPVIIKPFEKTEQWDRISPLHKVLHLHQKEDLKNFPFDVLDAADKVLVQQWIPGGDRNVYFCLVYYDENGRKVADYTGRKLFQWPILCGSTAAAIGEFNKEISRITEEIFNGVGFRGLGSVEFKLSDADGHFYIIEPTVGRNDLQSTLALAGNLNLPRLALSEIFGTHQPKSRKKISVWIHEEGLLDSIRAWRNHQLLNKRDLFRLMRIGISFAHLSVSDPGPGWTLLKNKLNKSTSKGNGHR